MLVFMTERIVVTFIFLAEESRNFVRQSPQDIPGYKISQNFKMEALKDCAKFGDGQLRIVDANVTTDTQMHTQTHTHTHM